MTGTAAFLGANESESLRRVEALVNQTGGIRGRPLKFIIEDNQSSPQVDVQLMNAAPRRIRPSSSTAARSRAAAPTFRC